MVWLKLTDGTERNFHYSVAAKLRKQGKATGIDNEVEEVKPKKVKQAKPKKVKKANG